VVFFLFLPLLDSPSPCCRLSCHSSSIFFFFCRTLLASWTPCVHSPAHSDCSLIPLSSFTLVLRQRSFPLLSLCPRSSLPYLLLPSTGPLSATPSGHECIFTRFSGHLSVPVKECRFDFFCHPKCVHLFSSPPTFASILLYPLMFLPQNPFKQSKLHLSRRS